MMQHVFEQQFSVSKSQRQQLNKHRSFIVWFTGLSGSGKSTLANELEKQLFNTGFHTFLLDGDNIRNGLNADLDFSEEGRRENIRRIGEVCKLFVDAGIIVITAFISPYKKDREFVRGLVAPEEFIEIFVNCPIEECIKRDTKGLYEKAKRGEIKNFTGINAPYETPDKPELLINTSLMPISESTQKAFNLALKKAQL